MDSEFAILLGTYLLVAVLVLAQPWMARKNVLFGVVFGSAEIWNAPEAKAARSRYLKRSGGIALLILIAMSLWLGALGPGTVQSAAVFSAFMLLMIVAVTVPYVLENRRMKAFKAQSAPEANLVHDTITVETGIGEGEAVVPATWTLLLLPLLLVSGALLLFGYDQIPAQIATHYGFSGPDAWVEKSVLNVTASLLLNAALTAVIWGSVLFTRRAPASVRGNPEAAPDALRYRKYMVLTLLFTGVMMQAIFLITVIGYFTAIPMLVMNVLLAAMMFLIFLLLALYFRFVRRKKPKGKILDDDARWLLGLFYYNPSDPSVFVEKRVGIGYTVNMARPVAWVFLLGVLALVIGSLFLF